MNEITIFNYEQNEIREITDKEGNPWFVAKDVCDILGINNVSKALKKLRKKERCNFKLGRQGKANIINEQGLYRLILRSDKPNAVKFQDWVVEDVLPQIRKTGTYSVQQQLPQTYVQALKALVASEEAKEQLQIENKAKDQKIEQDKPKVAFANSITASKGSVNLTAVSKITYGKLHKMNRNGFCAWLREIGILGVKNIPYQCYLDKGYFEVIEGKGIHENKLWAQTLVTGKGQEFIIGLLQKELEKSKFKRKINRLI